MPKKKCFENSYIRILNLFRISDLVLQILPSLTVFFLLFPPIPAIMLETADL